MTIEIVDLPINSMVIFHSYVTNYQEGRMENSQKCHELGGTPHPDMWWESCEDHGKISGNDYVKPPGENGETCWTTYQIGQIFQ